VPVRRSSNSQLLTAALLSCETIEFLDFCPNESKTGITYLTNISKRFKFNFYFHFEGLLNACDHLQINPK